MKTCIATVSIAGDFREKLAAIARAGFTGIEIFEQDFIAFDGRPEDVARMIKDHGLEIMLFQPFRDFEGMADPLRSRAFDRAERKFDLMNQLGVDLMLVCSNVSPHSLGGIDRAADDFAELGARAAALPPRRLARACRCRLVAPRRATPLLATTARATMTKETYCMPKET